MMNWKIVTLSLALLGAVSFVVCVLWGLLMPEAVHMHRFLEMVLPGFRWLSWTSFLLGLVESLLWGVYIGIVYVPIYNFLHRRWGENKPATSA